ncbi:MAG: glutathione S-transferase [Bradyrhizobium sp.]|nr:glutathione S-transferase [Bradyrhizobium sp.]
MIDLFSFATPNGRKISIALEEMGLPYTFHLIDIRKGDQFGEDFLAIAPNNRIPAIVDSETGITLMESGAILIYLAEKSGKLLSSDPGKRMRTIEWLMWQMGGLGPMLGQAHHFVHYNPDASDYARDRYLAEALRLYGVLDRRLKGRDYVADEFSIADIAMWPWISRFDWQGVDLNMFPEVRRWYLSLADRPAVQRGYDVPEWVNDIPRP